MIKYTIIKFRAVFTDRERGPRPFIFWENCVKVAIMDSQIPEVKANFRGK